MNKENPAVTIRDVARAAGVSPAAVSLALRGEGTLARATRERIRQVAQELNYRRNMFAASLRTRSLEGSGHGMPLGLLLHRVPQGMTYPISTYVQGLREEATRLGFTLAEEMVQGSVRPLLRMLYHRGVQGLVIPHCLDVRDVPPEEWARFSVVACNRGSESPRFHTVRSSSFDVVLRALHMMVERGWRRIGAALFRHQPTLLDDAGREAALLWAQQSLELEPIPPHLGDHEDRRAFFAWLQRYQPEAILAFHVGCLYWLREAGWRVPQQMAFCALHLENIPATQGVAGFYTPDVEMGRASILLMDSMIRHNERGIPVEVRETLIHRTWREGETLPYRAAVSAPARSRKIPARGQVKAR